MPDTRPDTHFVDGVCSACISYEKRKSIDWTGREGKLVDLINRKRNDSGYDMIVPSSGGKDSTAQVLKMIELGFRPLVVTATTCQLTPIGRANIDNLARYATTIEVSPNKVVRAKLNWIGLDQVGDCSWPEHAAIFTTPFKMAINLGIPLIIYGENPQEAYGGPPGSDEAAQMTRRWVSEFGGFLGLRASDIVGRDGITEHDMLPYMAPPAEVVEWHGIEAHFLGHYYPWDSHANAAKAIAAGMKFELPTPANLWEWENLDNAQTGFHDFAMYLKFGYGRGCAQASVDVRAGRMERESAMKFVMAFDGMFPTEYAGVSWISVVKRLGVSAESVINALRKFTNRELFARVGVDLERPILKEFV